MIKKFNNWVGNGKVRRWGVYVKFSMFEFHDASLAFARREIPKHLAA